MYPSYSLVQTQNQKKIGSNSTKIPSLSICPSAPKILNLCFIPNLVTKFNTQISLPINQTTYLHCQLIILLTKLYSQISKPTKKSQLTRITIKSLLLPTKVTIILPVYIKKRKLPGVLLF